MDDAALSTLAPALPDVNALMGDFVAQNPQLAWLPQMLALQQRQRASAPEPEPAEPAANAVAQIDALEQALAQSDARCARLLRSARRMAAELDAAQARLSDLAAAFGACGLCWGEDDDCPSCRGRGRPGRFAPDPELRSRFAADAVDAPAASRPSTPTIGPTERR